MAWACRAQPVLLVDQFGDPAQNRPVVHARSLAQGGGPPTFPPARVRDDMRFDRIK